MDDKPNNSKDFYADPHIYDVLHEPGTEAEVEGLAAIAARFVPGVRGPWLEPGCGTARYLRQIQSRGQPVAGFDRSAAMIAYAKRRLRGADLFVAEMDDFATFLPTHSVAFAFNPINTFRHIDTEDAALKHLTQMAAVLRPGAAYAVGLSLSRYGDEDPTEDVWEGARRGVSVRQVAQYLPPEPDTRRETVISHLAVSRSGEARHIDSKYTLRSYDRRQWLDLVEKSPLRIVGEVDEEGNDVAEGFSYSLHVLASR